MPNTLADFPVDRFHIYAYCACGHQARVPVDRLPPDLPVDVLRSRLCCSSCGSHEVGIRIVWMAAGGFQHGG